jgi:ribosomal protein L29
MKRNDWLKLRAKETPELLTQLSDLMGQLIKKRHEKVVGRLANPSSVARLADDVARIKTELKRRTMEAN